MDDEAHQPRGPPDTPSRARIAHPLAKDGRDLFEVTFRMIVGDTTTAGLHAALRGLDARRSAHEMNIANVETPGYRARSVQFESELRRAIDAGAPLSAGHSVEVSNAAGRHNGNNVNVDQEMVGLTEAALTQELVIRALNDKYGLLREAVRFA